MNIWSQRAFDVLIKEKGLIKGIPQGIKTIQKDKNDYSHHSWKQDLIMVPGFLCSQWTYVDMLDELNKNNEFNLIKVQDLPEWLKAIWNTDSIEESAKLLLQTIENTKSESIHLLWHSFGWNIAVLAEILVQGTDVESKIKNIISLSSPLAWSLAISQLPIVKAIYKSLWDMHPESIVSRAIRKAGRVNRRFITTQDEIFPPEEMDFNKWDEEKLDHWHFQYMTGDKKIIASTADKIRPTLIK